MPDIDFPPELMTLIGKRFGFKIEIKLFNKKNIDSEFYGVSRITEDEDIIAELERKLAVFKVIINWIYNFFIQQHYNIILSNLYV